MTQQELEAIKSMMESYIVDAIECESENYQFFEWGPVNVGLQRIRDIELEDVETVAKHTHEMKQQQDRNHM